MNTDKLRILIREFRGTELLKGNKISYFFYFWPTKALTFARRYFPALDPVVLFIIRLIKPFLPREFIIKNKIGIFTIPSIPDDSTAICCDYFESQLRHWVGLPERKDIFLDIGSNRGVYTLIALNQFGYKTAIAFEPNPKMFSLLSANVKNNAVEDKVTLFPTALGEQTATEEMYVEALHAGGGRISEGTRDKEYDKKLDIKKFTVNIEPLDNLIDLETAQKISFIKIDTEGFEEQVLRGGLKTFGSLQKGTYLMVESYKSERIANLLKSFGMVLVEEIAGDHLYKKV